LNGGEIACIRSYDLVWYPALEDIFKDLTLLGIRPQYEDSMRHYLHEPRQQPEFETIGNMHFLKKKKFGRPTSV